MAKLLAVMVLLGIILFIGAAYLYVEDRQQRRRRQARIALKELQTNPADAAWLYSQGLTPEEIAFAAIQRNGLK